MLPKFAQLTVTSYYASSSASHYGISLLTRHIEDTYTSRAQQEKLRWFLAGACTTEYTFLNFASKFNCVPEFVDAVIWLLHFCIFGIKLVMLKSIYEWYIVPRCFWVALPISIVKQLITKSLVWMADVIHIYDCHIMVRLSSIEITSFGMHIILFNVLKELALMKSADGRLAPSISPWPKLFIFTIFIYLGHQTLFHCHLILIS